MWKLYHKEGWAPKKWCFELWCWRRLLRIPWTARRWKQSNQKEINHEYSVERLMVKAKAEAPILWLRDTNSRLIGKYPDARKDWGQKEKGATEGEMVGWHHWLNGHEFEQTPGDSKGQGSLACFHGVTKTWMALSEWMATTKCKKPCLYLSNWWIIIFSERSSDFPRFLRNDFQNFLVPLIIFQEIIFEQRQALF